MLGDPDQRPSKGGAEEGQQQSSRKIQNFKKVPEKPRLALVRN